MKTKETEEISPKSPLLQSCLKNYKKPRRIPCDRFKRIYQTALLPYPHKLSFPSSSPTVTVINFRKMSKSSAGCSTSSSGGTTSSTAPTTSFSALDYSHSPVHYAVILRDHKTLSRIVSSLPKLADPAQIHSESDSISQERVADIISSILDRRDVPNRETPLHLAVRINDLLSAKLLAGAGADISLQSSSGWNPLQESLCQLSSKEISLTLLKSHHRAAWAKWRRRLPRLVSALRKMRDFYMEISFHFESSVIPFISKIAPSDTYKIWKVDGNLRADTTLAGFDGLKMQRADQSFLFYGDGHDRHDDHDIPPGSLLVLNRDENKIFDAFENAGGPMSESDVAGFCSQTSVYRPGMDVTNAELISRTNWRRQEKMESVGEWKAKVYDINNVVFSFRSRKVLEASPDAEQILPLELDEDEDGFLVAENPDFGIVTEDNSRRRHSSFVRDDREWFTAGRKSVDFIPKPEQRRKSTAVPPLPRQQHRPPPPILIPSRSTRKSDALRIEHPPPQLPPHPATHLPRQQVKEKEYVKSLRPAVWLTEQFPLKTEELLPLLDILASKVKAVRRMREVLTTKFPPGTFPVKVAIPVVPTVRVVITFTKFVELQSADEFFTPFSSPRHLGSGGRGSCSEGEQQSESPYYSLASSSAAAQPSWMRRSASSHSTSTMSLSRPKQQPQKMLSSQSCSQQLDADPFVIPEGFTRTSIIDDKSRKLKKTKSVRKSK